MVNDERQTVVSPQGRFSYKIQALTLYVCVIHQSDPNSLNFVLSWWKMVSWFCNIASVIDYLIFQHSNLKD